jgi:hypothetical protein
MDVHENQGILLDLIDMWFCMRQAILHHYFTLPHFNEQQIYCLEYELEVCQYIYRRAALTGTR